MRAVLTFAAWIVFAGSGCVIYERLPGREQVVGREGVALELKNGRRVDLPGIKSLADETPYLDAACARGVAVLDSRPMGQMKIGHWAGKKRLRCKSIFLVW